MKTKDFIAGNKLIAEFMGKEIEAITSYSDEPHEWHCSWDWLMPVVEKIESMGHVVEIVTHKTEIYEKDKYPNSSYVMMAPGDKINSTYFAIIEFINRHTKKA